MGLVIAEFCIVFASLWSLNGIFYMRNVEKNRNANWITHCIVTGMPGIYSGFCPWEPCCSPDNALW